MRAESLTLNVSLSPEELILWKLSSSYCLWPSWIVLLNGFISGGFVSVLRGRSLPGYRALWTCVHRCSIAHDDINLPSSPRLTKKKPKRSYSRPRSLNRQDLFPKESLWTGRAETESPGGRSLPVVFQAATLASRTSTRINS